MSRRERRADGKKSQRIPSRPAVATPSALYEAGLRHMRAEQHLDAQICCQQALAGDPNHAGTLHLMGLLSLNAKQYDHAVEWITGAIRQDPRPEYLASLGTTLQQQGRHEEALKVVDKAVQLRPDDTKLWRHLGDILVQLARFDQALLTFQHVLKLNPRHQDALYKSGALLCQLGRYEEAIDRLNLSDELLPNHAPTLQSRAWTLYNLKRLEESLAEGRRAHQLDPDDADTCNNLGLALQRLGRHEEALEWFNKALETRSSFSCGPRQQDNLVVTTSPLRRGFRTLRSREGPRAE
jgi:tetratricopeptide (TPR) repeat protein